MLHEQLVFILFVVILNPNKQKNYEGGDMAQGRVIIVADDHPLFRVALAQSIAALDSKIRIIEAQGFDDAHDAVKRHPDAELVVLDLNMPGMKGFAGLVYLRAEQPQIPVIIVSAVEDDSVIMSAARFGASGYIPKSTGLKDIKTAISMVLDGETSFPATLEEGSHIEEDDLGRRMASLTPQQVRVLTFLTEGKLNKQIAYELGISEATVKAHVSAILQKLNVNSRTQAVIVAGRLAVEDKSSDEAREAVITP